MIKSPKFTHSKKDNNKAQGRSTHLTAIVVSLVLSIIMITISVFNVSAVVITDDALRRLHYALG